jgi:hypothetical protein
MSVDVKLNRKGMRDLLQSAEVRSDLAARAARIAAAAGDGMESDSSVGSNRARASVWTGTYEARRAEADGFALSRAIDAGR